MRQESLTLALVLGAYFALQVVLRIWIGTGLQLDEADLVMRAQEFRWGYGPQLPLFNWLQFLTFKLIGVNVAALAIAKNAGYPEHSALGVMRSAWNAAEPRQLPTTTQPRTENGQKPDMSAAPEPTAPKASETEPPAKLPDIVITTPQAQPLHCRDA